MRISRIGLAFLLTVLSACSGSDAAPTTTTTTQVDTTTTSSTTTAPSTTTTTTEPPPRPGHLEVVGELEVVYDWTTDRCVDMDIPDLPARAFRDADGTVHLISTDPTARQFVGPTLDDVVKDCDPVFESAYDPDPAMWTDYEWIASTWTPDGRTVYALAHNEYHGWERGDCTDGNTFPCWYNSITALVSTDGGASFGHLVDPPGHLVASVPHPYTPDTAAIGMFSPSNIVQGPDDHWYALVKRGAHPTGAQTVCLMRTDDLADPTAWRFWDRNAFDGVFVDPYADEVERTRDHVCPALAIDEIGAQMIESLTWNTHLERWVLVGISADQIDGREVWGFYYSFSHDLIEWTHRELLLEVPLPWTVELPGADLSYLYPSLLDPASPSINFETTGETAYLYYTRNNEGHASLDRDLVRVPVQFSFADE